MKYKLIKEYPGSPKLGFITNNTMYFPEYYPSLWEPIVEKDYEILKLISSKSNPQHKENSKILDNKDYKFKQMYPTKYWDIYSVKRLYDGEVFTVSDNVIGNFTNTKYNISSFVIEGRFDKIIINSHAIHLNECKKLKQPLFTTEDGVDIYEGDKYCYVKFKENRKSLGRVFQIVTCDRPGCLYESQYEKYFSTKEKAEEYILMNKPVLSLNDLKQFFPDTYIPFKKGESATEDINTKQLEDLVKSKI